MNESADLIERYRRIRAATEAACAPLSPEDMVVQSMPDASPVKWHLAHTSWFFETFLLIEPTLGRLPPYDPSFNYLFNSYYEAVGPRHPRPQRGLLTRPTIEEVFRYRAHVDEAIIAALSRLDRGNRERWQPIMEIGLNHEQQHQELLLTDIKHAFAQNPLQPAYTQLPLAERTSVPALQWREYDAGISHIGACTGFAFDNERPRHRVFRESFAVADRPVTCGEYLAFMDDSGYERPEFWLADGWHTCQQHGWTAPLYWSRHDSCWKHFTLGGMRSIDPSEPICHLSFYEADAFASWAKARLPTEFEWEAACVHERPSVQEEAFSPVRPHPAPVTTQQLTGFHDVWEWTQSAYSPYPGFKAEAGALGEYNGKFMCNQMVLRGGSCLTPRSHIRSTYRNFFPPETRWQLTGLRLARSR